MIWSLAKQQGGQSVWAPALLVSICALVFTVASFWWLNARQGRLRCYEPHTFAAAVQGAVTLFLRFPLVLRNTGAAPIVVQDLRLKFPDEPNALLPLPWRTTRSQIKPDSDDGHQFPAVFALPGRAAERFFIEFGGPFPGLVLAARDYRVVIEVRVGHRKGWHTLLDFTLRAGHISFPEQYITYSNSPFDLTKEDKAKADKALRGLMEQLRQMPTPDRPDEQQPPDPDEVPERYRRRSPL
jgi:hypothetical protein